MHEPFVAFQFACAGRYFANHATAVQCPCGAVKPLGPWTSASTAHGHTPLTQTKARLFVCDDVLVASNAKALWGTTPQSDAELG
jgi:hypothetical protein